MKFLAFFAIAIFFSCSNATVTLPGKFETYYVLFQKFKFQVSLVRLKPIYFNHLSGIDVLSSGYDAATWSTKYSIFNFKEEGELVHINSINKTYTAPAMVNVVTDGMNSKRVEDSCIDVVSHFEGNS